MKLFQLELEIAGGLGERSTYTKKRMEPTRFQEG